MSGTSLFEFWVILALVAFLSGSMVFALVYYLRLRPVHQASDKLSKEIARRVCAEKVLRTTEENYRAIFENAAEGIAQSTPQGRFISANSAFAKMLGYESPQDLIESVTNIPGQIYVNPEERIKLLKKIEAAPSSRVEVEVKTKQGRQVWLSANVRTVRDELGKVRYYESIAEDVTERRETLRALAEGEARLKLALDASRMGTWDWNLENDTVVCDAIAASLFGVEDSSSPRHSQGLMANVVPEDVESLVETIHRAFAKGSEYQAEYRVTWADDSTRWLLVMGRPILGEKGLPCRAIGTVLEITARKQAEEEKQKLTSLLESSSDLVGLATLGGRFIYLNRSGRELLDLSVAEVKNRSIVECYALKERERLQQALVEILNRGSGRWHCRSSLRRFSNGEEIQSDVNLSLILDEKTRAPIAFGIVARDVRQEIENEITLRRHAGELARSNRELEQFAYVSSHDLREPLRMVTVYVELLRKHLEGKLDEESEEYIEFAVEGARRMSALINDLLLFSRIGKELQPFEVVDGNTVVRTALANLREPIREARAVVKCEDMPQVAGSQTQLVQLFQNLISNAIKFRGERSPQIAIGVARVGNEWLFSIRDNGIGIKPRYLSKVFTIFGRLHAAQKYPGTGMGLSICKKIVESHEGRIWADSQLGIGSVFHFTLPRVLNHESTATA